MTASPPESAGPARDERRRQRHADTRREILDLAWTLADEVGLAGISLGEIARRLRIRTPSLYTYFASKHAVFDAMFREAADAHLARFAALELPDEPRAALRLGFETFFDFCVERPARYTLLFQRTIPGFAPSPEAYQVAVDALALNVAQLRAGGLTDPVHLDLALALGTGLVDQQLSNEPGGRRWRAMIPAAVDMLVRTLPPGGGA